MLRSNAEVERYLVGRIKDAEEAERIAKEGPGRPQRQRPPPRVREPLPDDLLGSDMSCSELSDSGSSSGDDSDSDGSDSERRARRGKGGRKRRHGSKRHGGKRSKKSARKGGNGGGGSGPQAPPPVPVNTEELVKRYLYRTKKGVFGPFSVADLRTFRPALEAKGVFTTMRVWTLAGGEDTAVELPTLLEDFE